MLAELARDRARHDRNRKAETVKATIDRATLRDATALAKRFVSSRTRVTLPGLAGVLVETHGDGAVRLTAHDLETVCRVELAADVHDAGRALVPLAALHDALARGGTVSLTVDDDGAAVALDVDGVTRTLHTLDIDEWPAPPVVDGPATVTLSPRDVDTLARVAHAASRDEVRPVLTGVKFDGRTAYATDSFRLARGTLDADTGPLGGANVPAGTVRNLAKLNADGASMLARADVDTYSAGSVRFDAPHYAGPARKRRQLYVTVTVRALEGQYPNAAALWPSEHDHVWEGAADELRDAFDACARLAGKHEHVPARLSCNGTGSLAVSAELRDTGTVDLAVPLTRSSAAKVALRPVFAREAVDAVSTSAADTVRIYLRDPLKPVVVAGGTTVTVLVMPVRVS